MKVQVTLEFDIKFDLESDGETLQEHVVDDTTVKRAIIDALHWDSVMDGVLDNVTDHTGFCVSSFAVFTREVESVQG